MIAEPHLLDSQGVRVSLHQRAPYRLVTELS
jgi:hypothetical protein